MPAHKGLETEPAPELGPGTPPAAETDECASEAGGSAQESVPHLSEACAKQALQNCRERGGQGWGRRQQHSDSRRRDTVAAPIPNRCTKRAKPPPNLRAWDRSVRGPQALASSGGSREVGAARPLEMEWHMKRLCQRCGVDPERLARASLTPRPEPDWKWVLLWRDNQRHRPPSKG